MSRLIGIDWGSSNVRAYLFDSEGDVIERRTSSQGIIAVRDGAFEPVIDALIGDWTDGDVNLILSGMVGSRGGWHEVPYIACPASIDAIVDGCARVETRLGRAMIVPGVLCCLDGRASDVMRGEETQVLGSGVADGTVVLPGTHSKWTTIASGRIVDFRTAMTGELHALLLDHSLLGRLAQLEAKPGDAAFLHGVDRSLDDPALAMTLFSARADVLTGALAPADVSAYLSGLLIGAEVEAMTGGNDDTLTIVGGAALAARYRAALERAGRTKIVLVDGDEAAARGLWALGKTMA